jgi:transcriptional regulator with XRE-family HTH domain
VTRLHATYEGYFGEKKEPTLKDLAKLANVSAATVSRVAAGQIHVDATIRARVRRAAETLGIDIDQKRNEKPNIIAFMLAIGMFLIISRPECYLATRLTAAQGRDLLFTSFHYSPTVQPKELHLPKILTQRGTSGP